MRPHSSSPTVWVIVNQLACPGLGTILSGRKVGYAQTTVMVAGFILSMGYMLWYIACLLRRFAHLDWTDAEFVALYRPYRWALFWGLGLCAAAWVWSGLSSLSILREAKRK